MKRGTGITVMRIRRYLVVCGGAPTSGLRNLGNRLYAFAHERFRNEEVGLFWMKRNEREERGENKDTYIYIYKHGRRERERKRAKEREFDGTRKRELDSSRSGSRWSLDFALPSPTNGDERAEMPRSQSTAAGSTLRLSSTWLPSRPIHVPQITSLSSSLRLPDDYSAYYVIQHGDIL